MKKTIYTLSGLLVAQVALAIGMNTSSRGFAGEAARTKLLDVPTAKIMRLAITGADGKTVVLAKKGKAWVLPEEGGFPAAGHRVNTVLKDLAKAEESPPVATTAGAPKRFKVAKDGFERRLVLGPEKSPLATVYLGNSQGVRQVYVRRAGQKGVRTMDFGLYLVSANANDWVDSNALKVDAKKITSIGWGDVKITRTPHKAEATADGTTPADTKTADAKGAGGKASAAKPAAKSAPGWEVQIGSAAPVPAGTEVKSLTDQLGSLWIEGLAPGKSSAPEGKEKLDLSIGIAGGKTLYYRLMEEKDGSYILAASNLPRLMKLSPDSAKGLLKLASNKAFAPPTAKAVAAPAATPAAKTPVAKTPSTNTPANAPAKPQTSAPAATSGG